MADDHLIVKCTQLLVQIVTRRPRFHLNLAETDQYTVGNAMVSAEMIEGLVAEAEAEAEEAFVGKPNKTDPVTGSVLLWARF